MIGAQSIKARRKQTALQTSSSLMVADCVPFYFCPRSIMLYVIHKGNHSELNYRGGQRPILHLEADIHEVVAWAQAHQKHWCFTLSNAGSVYFEERDKISQLTELKWNAIRARDWRERSIQEGKQAEFLLQEYLPVQLIQRIGVHSSDVKTRVENILKQAGMDIAVDVLRRWYY